MTGLDRGEFVDKIIDVETKPVDVVDLALADHGGKVLWVTDDYFAEGAHLIKSEPAIFESSRYTERGSGWMDGNRGDVEPQDTILPSSSLVWSARPDSSIINTHISLEIIRHSLGFSDVMRPMHRSSNFGIQANGRH